MKTKLCTVLLALLLSMHWSPISIAQDDTQWSLPEGAKARLGKGKITDMKLSQDGSQLAIASTIGVNLYDISTGAETVLLTKDTDLVGPLAFSPDGTKLAHTDGEKKCYIWHVENSKLLSIFYTNETSYKSIFFLPDEKTLVSRNWEDKFSFWDITTGKLLETFSPKASEIKIKGNIWNRAMDGVVTNNNSLIYAIGNHDGTISLQDGKTNQHIQTLVSKTNNDLFYTVRKEKHEEKILKVVPFPQEPEQAKDEKPRSLNLRDDGKRFPIQYQMDQGMSSLQLLDEEPMKWVTDLKFSPDGKLLISRCRYKTLKLDGTSSGNAGPTELWNVETGEQLAALPWWVDVKFSRDSETLAILSERGLDTGRCDIWDLVDMHRIARFQSISHAKFSGDGGKLLLRKGGSYHHSGKVIEKGSFTIWDIATQSEVSTHVLNEGPLWITEKNQLLSRDGKILVTATAKDNVIVEVWETEKETPPRKLTTGYIDAVYADESTALAFTPDGTMLAGGSSGIIRFWKTANGSEQNSVKIEKDRIQGLIFDKENNIINVVNFRSTDQYDINTGQLIAANTNPIHFGSSGGPSVEYDDGTTIFFSLYTYSPEFKAFVTIDRRGKRAEIWNTETRKKIGMLTDKASHLARGSMALTPKGDILATHNLLGREYEVLLWNTDTDKRIAALDMSRNFVDKLISRFTHPNITAMEFDYDGKLLVVGTTDKQLQLWDITTLKRTKHVKTPHDYTICKFAFSPDGSLLASGDTTGNINLWETNTCQHIATYKGHKRNINVLVFAQNNKFLASTGLYDGTIMLWDVPTK